MESYIQEQKPLSENFTSDTEIISLDSDDDDLIPFKSQDITTWYSNVLKSLERRYPMAFDLVVKDVMTSNPRKKRNCLKNVLGKNFFLNFFYKIFNINNNLINIFLKI